MVSLKRSEVSIFMDGKNIYIFKPPLENINESEASDTGISVKEKAMY